MSPRPTLRRVLICEDTGVTLMALRKAFLRAGYDVVGEVADCEKVVSLAKHLQPDFILMDIGLVGPFTGIEATRQILQAQHVPIIMFSAYSDQENITAALKAGACGYLIKPITSEQLIPAIEAALARFERGLDAHKTVLAAPSFPKPAPIVNNTGYTVTPMVLRFDRAANEASRISGVMFPAGSRCRFFLR